MEHHLLAHKPSKQVFIGAGLPILPKRLVDKMHNGEYINFNEMLPFCDPGSEEDIKEQEQPNHFIFPGLGLVNRGHKLNYSFTQWASCFVTYMAALAANNNNFFHMCAYFQVILKASREYAGSTWKYYDAQYRQKAEATRNKDWSVIDSSLFSQCFTGRAKPTPSCSHCASLKHDSADCPRERRLKRASTSSEEKDTSKNPSAKRSDICYNFNYRRPCHVTPYIYKHQCLRCAPEEHPIADCPSKRKRPTPKP